MGCVAVRWQGATTRWADAHKEEQRRKQPVAQLNRVRSARYKLDLALEAKKVNIHVVFFEARERPGEICGLATLLGHLIRQQPVVLFFHHGITLTHALFQADAVQH